VGKEKSLVHSRFDSFAGRSMFALSSSGDHLLLQEFFVGFEGLSYFSLILYASS
jgi:hypothetical protein